MFAPRSRNYSSLFRSAIKTASKTSSTSSSTPSPGGDKSLKHFVSSLDISSLSSSLKKHPDDSLNQISGEISSILCGDSLVDATKSQEKDDERSFGGAIKIPWFTVTPHSNISLRRKEVTRERKQKWIFKNSQVNCFERLVRMCTSKLGTEATIKLFGKLGKETGLKEYSAMISICVEEARSTDDEDTALEWIYRVFQLFKLLRQEGFQLKEESFGPFLMYLIDMSYVQEFNYFCGIIKEENPNSVSRLGYYEMLLWIGVNNTEKIQELCNFIAGENREENLSLKENYLLALCESERKEELVQLLRIIDITKLSSMDCVASIFKSLGKLSLESLAEVFLLTLKTRGYEAEGISDFIFTYATSMQNLALEDIVSKFEELHEELELTPLCASYEKLIMYACDAHEAVLALDMVEKLCEAGLLPSVDTLNSILRASEECCEFNLVQRVYSLICKHNLKRNSETFRSIINLCVRIKDYEGAFNMINNLEKMNLMPSASMYNAIIAGYFREKNVIGAQEVLKKMERADVKPDSQTYSYLIGNCYNEKDIIKYCEEMKHSGIQVTKHIYMALINAYVACGEFEKAKQVACEKGIPDKATNEVKSALVSALASHGRISDALDIYEDIKQARGDLEPRAIIALIEHQQSEGELSRLLQLLNGLHDRAYWVDGCSRIISYCIRHKHLSAVVDLLKKLKGTFSDDEMAMEAIFDEAFCLIAEAEPTDLQFGMDLLHAIKSDLGLYLSRKSLDFLLTACVSAKDKEASLLIWKEYQAAGLPYNVLSFLRMYQALMATGDHISAKIIQKQIPRDDPHIRYLIKEYQETYSNFTQAKGTKGGRKKKVASDERETRTYSDSTQAKEKARVKKKKVASHGRDCSKTRTRNR